MSPVSARICARPLWNDTKIDVRAGERWRLWARGRWADWFVPCGPGGYRTALLEAHEHKRRAPEAAWFALIGAVERDLSEAFEIGVGREIDMPRTGRLYAFANDLERMYWNNWGAVTLFAERLRLIAI